MTPQCNAAVWFNWLIRREVILASRDADNPVGRSVKVGAQVDNYLLHNHLVTVRCHSRSQSDVTFGRCTLGHRQIVHWLPFQTRWLWSYCNSTQVQRRAICDSRMHLQLFDWRKHLSTAAPSSFADMPMLFSRCRLTNGSDQGHIEDIPLVHTEEYLAFIDRVLPLMDKPDTFILSFTQVRTVYIENEDKLGLVMYSLRGCERKYVRLGCI